ncbi:MAG: Rrf2 family transcriptional regulator [Candidatus Eisenbacteria bacterium]|nr:Rrf2 family transcriptional regulator [Candidatus Eisenbacteria bacterium]
MRVTTRGRYGLRVVMELAACRGRGPMTASAIARNQGISGKYVRVLAARLGAAGIVTAVRGPRGGYALTREPSAITAREVVAALEGPLAPVACVHDALSCPRSRRCAARDVWCDVARAVDGVLASLTMDELAARHTVKQQRAAPGRDARGVES